MKLKYNDIDFRGYLGENKKSVGSGIKRSGHFSETDKRKVRGLVTVISAASDLYFGGSYFGRNAAIKNSLLVSPVEFIPG